MQKSHALSRKSNVGTVKREMAYQEEYLCGTGTLGNKLPRTHALIKLVACHAII